MAVGVYNYGKHVDGDTLGLVNWNFFLNDTDTPEDLTGATPVVTWRRGSLRGKIIQTLTVGAGLSWVDQSIGQLRQENLTTDWGVGDYFYDLQLTYPDGSIYTKVQGQMKLTAQSSL